jgi:hypothetical protein
MQMKFHNLMLTVYCCMLYLKYVALYTCILFVTVC